MKYFEWDEAKNKKLIKERGISFEMCITYIQDGFLLDDIENKTPNDHQRVFIINIEGYVYRVPYVEDDVKIFFKTAYPSSRDTKKYLEE